MEHYSIQQWAKDNNISKDDNRIESLLEYGKLVFKNSKKFNITGLKTIEDINSKLIIDSLEPIKNINVPRGTSFADIGTGGGIPGIPISILFKEFSGLLLDSNSKRIDFVNNTIVNLKLNSITAKSVRLEEEGRSEENREQYDWVFSRAIGNPYVTIELGSPFLKVGGYLYVYSNIKDNELYPKVIEHAKDLGLSLQSKEDSKEIGISQGLLFKKESLLNNKYPRRFAVIKRDGSKFEWNTNNRTTE